MLKLAGIGALFAAFATGAAFADDYAVVGATVFDGTGAAPFPATVVVKDGKISAVLKNASAPAGMKTIDATGLALVPGFFDLHVHTETERATPFTLPQIMQAYVASGVTNINDFQHGPEAYAVLREWLKMMPAPVMHQAGRMSLPGGHGMTYGDTTYTTLSVTPFAGKEAVKSLLPYKPDVIKVMADGWRYGSGIDETSMNLNTLAAIVEEAHLHGLPVLTHTVTVEHGTEDGKANVDVIAHSMQDRVVDAAAIKAIVEGGTAYAPTLALIDPDKPGSNPDVNSASYRARMERFNIALTNVKKLYDAGVPLTVGTDSGVGNTDHGVSSLREIELLVRAGLSPLEALKAATHNSARAIHHTDRGTIEPGMRADFVLINGKPWATISDVHKVVRTFIEGEAVFGGGVKIYEATHMPASALTSNLIDDFERADGRTSRDTLRFTDYDLDLERSTIMMSTIAREKGGKALSVIAKMAWRDDAFAGVVLPLNRAAIQPIDASKKKGVELEVRGAGDYEFTVRTLQGLWTAPFNANGKWKKLQVPFASLKANSEVTWLTPKREGATWQADEILEVRVVMRRPSGETAWVEMDNVRFY